MGTTGIEATAIVAVDFLEQKATAARSTRSLLDPFSAERST